MSTALPVRRRCGYRAEGGIYVEVPLSEYGMPLSHFLLDPAVPVGPEMGIPDRGMILRDNILFDRIGGDYPNVLDFIFEVDRLGVSRRIQSNFDFSRLDHEVRYAIVHPRGYALHEPAVRLECEADQIRDRMSPWLCPKCIHSVQHGTGGRGPCSGVWWHDVDADVPEGEQRITSVDGRTAWRRPRDVDPHYLDAIIAVFPLVQLTVIKARDNSHIAALEKARKVSGNIEVTVSDV